MASIKVAIAFVWHCCWNHSLFYKLCFSVLYLNTDPTQLHRFYLMFDMERFEGLRMPTLIISLTSWKMLCPYLSVQSMSAPFFRTVSTYSRLMLSLSSPDRERRAKYSIRLRLCATTMCFCVLVMLASHTSTSSTSNVRPIPPVLRRSNAESPSGY